MNEQQRMQYLEALGVEMFTPRWVLPGARASHLCQLPVANSAEPVTVAAVEESQSSVAHQGGQGAPQQTADAVVSHLLDTVGEPTGSPLRTAAPEPAAEATPAQTAANAQKVKDEAAFSLAFWRVHQHIMVVDSRQPKALPTHALLHSILAAQGLRNALPQAEIQNWPVPGSNDKSWQSAREMIQVFLETRLLQEPVKYLLIFGQEAARAVLIEPESEADYSQYTDAPQAEAAQFRRANLDAFACEALLAPSLAQLLLRPTLKSKLWPLLAPLRLGLNG